MGSRSYGAALNVEIIVQIVAIANVIWPRRGSGCPLPILKWESQFVRGGCHEAGQGKHTARLAKS